MRMNSDTLQNVPNTDRHSQCSWVGIVSIVSIPEGFQYLGGEKQRAFVRLWLGSGQSQGLIPCVLFKSWNSAFPGGKQPWPAVPLSSP